MSIQDKVVESSSVYYMPCDICGEHSQTYPSHSEALHDIQDKGWVSKSYYKNLLSIQDWYCPKCAIKATEERDTIPDILEVKEQDVESNL